MPIHFERHTIAYLSDFVNNKAPKLAYLSKKVCNHLHTGLKQFFYLFKREIKLLDTNFCLEKMRDTDL